MGQVAALMTVRGGGDAAAGQQQALAALDRLITGQAAVLSFEHAFQVIALFFLTALVATLFLPAGRRPASRETASIDL
jgi:hypothetical protein